MKYKYIKLGHSANWPAEISSVLIFPPQNFLYSHVLNVNSECFIKSGNQEKLLVSSFTFPLLCSQFSLLVKIFRPLNIILDNLQLGSKISANMQGKVLLSSIYKYVVPNLEYNIKIFFTQFSSRVLMMTTLLCFFSNSLTSFRNL